MKKNCLITLIWLFGLSTLNAQWTPDIATLNYKTGLNEDSTSTRALYAIRLIPNETYHNEFLIFVPERLDRQYLRKEFFNLSTLQTVKPHIERVNSNVYRVSKLNLPVGEYFVHFRYKGDIAVHRFRIVM